MYSPNFLFRILLVDFSEKILYNIYMNKQNDIKCLISEDK